MSLREAARISISKGDDVVITSRISAFRGYEGKVQAVAIAKDPIVTVEVTTKGSSPRTFCMKYRLSDLDTFPSKSQG